MEDTGNPGIGANCWGYHDMGQVVAYQSAEALAPARFDAMVLGGGGGKGVVYADALEMCHRTGSVDVCGLSHVIGSGVGALTAYILALGGTPRAVKMHSPSMRELLPETARESSNQTPARILAPTIWNGDYRCDDVYAPHGARLPLALSDFTRQALACVLMVLCGEPIGPDRRAGVCESVPLRVRLRRFYRTREQSAYYYHEDFWIAKTAQQHAGELSAAQTEKIRKVVLRALYELDTFGSYLMATHIKLLKLLPAWAGWKHLTATVTELLRFSGARDARKLALKKRYGSLKYASTMMEGSSEFRRIDREQPQEAALAAGDENPFIPYNRRLCLMAVVRASAAYPVLFAPVALPVGRGGRKSPFIDGGCVSSIPIEVPELLFARYGRMPTGRWQAAGRGSLARYRTVVLGLGEPARLPEFGLDRSARRAVWRGTMHDGPRRPAIPGKTNHQSLGVQFKARYGLPAFTEVRLACQGVKWAVVGQDTGDAQLASTRAYHLSQSYHCRHSNSEAAVPTYFSYVFFSMTPPPPLGLTYHPPSGHGTGAAHQTRQTSVVAAVLAYAERAERAIRAASEQEMACFASQYATEYATEYST